MEGIAATAPNLKMSQGPLRARLVGTNYFCAGDSNEPETILDGDPISGATTVMTNLVPRDRNSPPNSCPLGRWWAGEGEQNEARK